MKKGRDRLQPRNAREQRLVDETLRDADEIRAARAVSYLRAVTISPHYTPRQKATARAWLTAKQGTASPREWLAELEGGKR